MLPPVKKCICCCLSHQNPGIYLFRAVLACKRCLIWCRFLSWFRPEHFSLEEVLLWIMNSHFNQNQQYEVKNVLMMDYCVDVDYSDVFISCLDSHSDGTHSLQSIHCWDTDAETHFYKPDEDTNSSTSWMTWRWARFQQMLIFGWTFSLRILFSISPFHIIMILFYQFFNEIRNS